MSFTAVPGPATLDHIAVAARTLDEGVAWVTSLLGVQPGEGGAHADMGTHNRLLCLGDDVYLEVIAPDPAVARPPIWPRWFGFDDPNMQTLLHENGPRLVGYVARTRDIHSATKSALVPPGEPRRISRGALEWLFTVAADGLLPQGGALPPLIQWPDGMVSPASRMPDLGLSLVQLEIAHPSPDHILTSLAAIEFRSDLVRVVGADTVRLQAQIRLPDGRIALIG